MKKILIIEDDTDIVDITKWMLEEKFDIISNEDLMPIEKIIEINPNLIILDNRLPGGSGNNFCLEIKRNPFTNKIPVIIFSADTNLDKSEHYCADAYVEKPFDVYDFEQIVNRLIKSPFS